MFNPLDELQPDLHTGGQSLPMQPNIQSIITFIKVSFIFHQQKRVYSRSEAKGEFYTGGKKKCLPGFFANAALKEAKHFPQASVYSSPFDAKAFPSHSIIHSEDINLARKHTKQQSAGRESRRCGEEREQSSWS